MGMGDQAASSAWIAYNEDIDPQMAALANLWAASVKAEQGAFAHSTSADEVVLAGAPEATTSGVSLSLIALMALFLGSAFAIAVNRFGRVSTQSKEAFMIGYSPFNP